MLPSLGAPVVWPVDSIPEALLGELVRYAVAAAAGAPGGEPTAVAHAVPIRIGTDVVGVVAAVRANGADVASGATDDGPWLEAAAAAAAVTRLMDDGRRSEQQDSRRALLRTLTSVRAPIPR